MGINISGAALLFSFEVKKILQNPGFCNIYSHQSQIHELYHCDIIIFK